MTMKLLLSLTVVCTIFSLCYGDCTFELVTPKIVNGKIVIECIDSSDGSIHPVGSKWNTKNCSRCACFRHGLYCCARYVVHRNLPGCIAIQDPETCKYKYYKIDNPSIPCLSG